MSNVIIAINLFHTVEARFSKVELTEASGAREVSGKGETAEGKTVRKALPGCMANSHATVV
jgi:hypothetical protein